MKHADLARDYLIAFSFRFDEVEAGFDDWVRWLQSIRLVRGDPVEESPFEEGTRLSQHRSQADHKNPRRGVGKARRIHTIASIWLDDGGESGEGAC